MSFTLNSGLVIFEIINILSTGPKSRKEICEELKQKGIAADKKTVTKYMRTLRAAGFEICVEDRGLQILKTPFEIELSKKEKEGLALLLLISKNFFKKEKLDLIKYKLLNLAGNPKLELPETKENIPGFIEEKAFENFEILNKYIWGPGVKIKLKYEKKRYEIIPKRIEYRKNGIFLHAYNKKTKKIQIFKAELIENIKFTGFVGNEFEGQYEKTVFKITGRLKKNYVLKEGEIAYYTDKEIFVSNACEEKEALFARLTKYGKFCEVVSPESDRKKFIKHLKRLLKHYKSM